MLNSLLDHISSKYKGMEKFLSPGAILNTDEAHSLHEYVEYMKEIARLTTFLSEDDKMKNNIDGAVKRLSYIRKEVSIQDVACTSDGGSPSALGGGGFIRICPHACLRSSPNSMLVCSSKEHTFLSTHYSIALPINRDVVTGGQRDHIPHFLAHYGKVCFPVPIVDRLWEWS